MSTKSTRGKPAIERRVRKPAPRPASTRSSSAKPDMAFKAASISHQPGAGPFQGSLLRTGVPSQTGSSSIKARESILPSGARICSSRKPGTPSIPRRTSIPPPVKSKSAKAQTWERLARLFATRATRVVNPTPPEAQRKTRPRNLSPCPPERSARPLSDGLRLAAPVLSALFEIPMTPPPASPAPYRA